MKNKPSGARPEMPEGERCSILDIPFRQRKGLLGMFGDLMVALLFLSIVQTASARTVTVENYLRHRNAFSNFHISWLDGVFNGLKAANAEMQRENKPLLFCPPADFSMTEGQVGAFFDKYIASHKDKVRSSDFIGVLLLDALREAYPCP
jgi:hypothetical protein